MQRRAHRNSHLLVRWEKRVESSTRECTAVGQCSVTLLVYLQGGGPRPKAANSARDAAMTTEPA